jgi:hypothetical protein
VIFEVPDVLATAEVWSLITGSDAESIEHDGAIVHLCDRELVFRTGPANHITSLEFTGAGESLAGKSFGIGESSLNFL